MSSKKPDSLDPWAKPSGGLINWLKDHGRTFNDTTLYVSQRLASSLFVWFLVGIALALPGILWLAQVNLHAVGEGWQGRAGLTVYFDAGVNPSNIEAILKDLETMPLVDKTALTTSDQALQDFVAQTSDSLELRNILASLDENPLPASIQITSREGADFIELESLQRQLRAKSQINDVVIEKTWLERLRDITSLLNRLGWILGLLFGLGAIFVTSASVRLAIESRLEELLVLALVGATKGQMRRPFIYFGACYGVGGGVMAVMFLALILNAIEGPLQALLGSYQVPLVVQGFNGQFILSMLGIGIFLGVIGAWVAVRQRLHSAQFL